MRKVKNSRKKVAVLCVRLVINNYLAEESRGATELGDGAGDVGGCATGRLDEAAGLGEGETRDVGDEVDEHLPERDHQVGRGRGRRGITERSHRLDERTNWNLTKRIGLREAELVACNARDRIESKRNESKEIVGGVEEDGGPWLGL